MVISNELQIVSASFVNSVANSETKKKSLRLTTKISYCYILLQ